MRAITWTALSLSASALAMAAVPAAAQSAGTGTQTIAEDGAGDPKTEVVVTGSRIPGRTAADSPVPIDVIGGDQLKNSGYTETSKVLNQLVPSFNFPQPSLTDGTDSLRPATLRGLAPDQTLVLVNGKRRHTSALVNLNGSVGRGSSAVDLNEIPAVAIDRVEVLRDGASSQYGSDAIAGVINLQLSKAVGAYGSVTYGKYDSDMSGVNQVTGVATGANGQPVVLSGGGSNSDILQLTDNGKKRHVSDGQTVTTALRLGLPVTDGYLVVSGQFQDRQPTNRSGYDPRRQYNYVAAGAGDPRELTFNRINHRYGDGQTDDYNMFVNAGHDLGAGFELYAFGSYGIRDGDGAGFFRRSNDVRNRNYSASTTSFVPFYADGFLPLIDSQIRDAAASVGVRGDLGDGWKEDLSVVYGTDKLSYQVENSFNTSLGAASPLKFDAGSLAFGQTTVNLDLSKKYEVGFLSSLGVAVGGEYRNENFKIRAGEPASYVNGPFSANGAPGGAQVFPGFRPNNAIDVSRDSFAGYAEVDADVTEKFTLQLAGRYEHFSDFGSTVNGKAAARWEPIPGYAIRGSISTGFRAPSLQQQYFATTSTNSTTVNGQAQLIEVGTFPATSAVATALGGKPLKPEKALNLAGGVALTPFRGYSLTVDYYNIKIRDRVLLTENLTGTSVTNLLLAQGINNVTSARFFVNGADTRTQGVDVVGSYRVPDFGYGKIVLTAGFNYNDTSISRRASLPSLPGIILYGRTESYRITDGQPRTKLTLSGDYDYGPVGLTLRTNRYGSVFLASGTTSINGVPVQPDVAKGAIAGDYTLTPKWISDVELRLHPYKHIDVAIGSNNVFDVYPRRAPLGGAFAPNSYFLPYSSLSPFGFNGRFLYGRVAVSF